MITYDVVPVKLEDKFDKSIKIGKNRSIISNLCLQNLMRVMMKVCLLMRMRQK